MILLVVLVWIHLLSVILWFGGSALMAFVIGPVLGATGSETRALTGNIAARSHRYYAAAGGVAILSGLILAWLTGRFSSPLMWVVIVIAVFLAYWGAQITGRAADAIAAANDAERPAAIARMVRSGTIEIAGFVIAFTLMVLVRFGF